jgi:hypothetical protein
MKIVMEMDKMDKIVINTAIQTIVSVLSTVFSYFKSFFQEVRIQNSIFIASH